MSADGTWNGPPSVLAAFRRLGDRRIGVHRQPIISGQRYVVPGQKVICGAKLMLRGRLDRLRPEVAIRNVTH